MDESIRYASDREAYIIAGENVGERYRIVVPLDLIEEETGRDAGEEERLDWLRANLPRILQAYTVRISGGHVEPPWGRLLVEEVD